MAGAAGGRKWTPSRPTTGGSAWLADRLQLCAGLCLQPDREVGGRDVRRGHNRSRAAMRRPRLQCARVYLHDLAFAADAEEFFSHASTVPRAGRQSRLRVIPVIFDECGNPNPRPGRQPERKKGVHTRLGAEPALPCCASRRGLPRSRATCARFSAASATTVASCCGTCGTSRTIPTAIRTARRIWVRQRPGSSRRCSIGSSLGKGGGPDAAADQRAVGCRWDESSLTPPPLQRLQIEQSTS